jgi:peptide methionine sulfoxide reductase msrA/msrB
MRGKAAVNEGKTEKATFAGGCFWCMVSPFENLEGVIGVTSGYTGGPVARPPYEEGCSGRTGHTEAVLIEFDPARTSYVELLEVFWRNIDPTRNDGQFADRGSQYRPAIFYHDDNQKLLAEESRDRLAASGRFDRPIAVEITPASAFYAAEDYHQDFHVKNPDHYRRYREGSGRSSFLARVWSDKEPGPS